MFPEYPTYITAGSRVRAQREPMGASGRSLVLSSFWPASGLVHLYVSCLFILEL
jgi:hypothetical protein